ncbi:MAG: hypothetical protein ACSHYA_05355 [Opitutaceae bacterium]
MNLLKKVFLAFVVLASPLSAEKPDDEAMHSMNLLSKKCLSFADEQLLKHGEFQPFGMSFDNNGKFLSIIAIDSSKLNQLEDQIEMLREIRKSHSGSFGITYAKLVKYSNEQKERNAVIIEFDYQSEWLAKCIYPYNIIGQEIEWMGAPVKFKRIKEVSARRATQ